MSSGESPANLKKNYDDISFQQRIKLINLIDSEKWTIRKAAQQIGIKLCTAKHILYLWRKERKIYRKKGNNFLANGECQDVIILKDPANVVYVPYPFYIFCPSSLEQMPINLEHSWQN